MGKFTKIFKNASVLLLISLVLTPAHSSLANGTISVSNVPTIGSSSQGAAIALGTILIDIPENSLQSGDQLSFTLPKGFSFHNPFDSAIEKDAHSLTVPNGAYIESGFDKQDSAGTATFIGNNTVVLRIDKLGTPTGDFKLVIKLGDIMVNGVSGGPVNITFAAPSTSSFSSLFTKSPGLPKTNKQKQNLPVPVQKETAKFTVGQLSYTLNGKERGMDIAPFLGKDNRLILPARYVANAWGVGDDSIAWNSAENTVTIKTVKLTVSFTANQPFYLTNEVAVPMDTKTVLKDGRIMVPFRYLAEAFGGEITWDDSTKTATIFFSIPVN